jgi:hypothetical protein
MKSAMTGFGDSAHHAMASLLPGGSSGSAFRAAELQKAPMTSAEHHLPGATFHEHHIEFSQSLFMSQQADKKSTDKNLRETDHAVTV